MGWLDYAIKQHVIILHYYPLIKAKLAAQSRWAIRVL